MKLECGEIIWILDRDCKANIKLKERDILGDKLRNRQLVDRDDVFDVLENVGQESIFALKTVEEVVLCEDTVPNWTLGGDLGVENGFETVFVNVVTDHEKIDGRVLVHKNAAENHVVDVAALRELLGNFLVVAHRLENDASELLEDDEVFVDDVIFFSELEFALQEANFLEIIKFTADRIDLFVELSRQLTDEILFIGVKEKKC